MSPVKYISLQTEQYSKISEANILCLGNFDGVHLAHRTLMRKAKELQAQKMPNARVGVFCFEKLSSDFLSSNPPKHITTLEQKLKYFADEKMDFAYIADFSSLKELSPEAFVRNILIEKCACTAIVCGYNYTFGKDGFGNYQLLQQLLTPERVIVTEPICQMGEAVSSTRIRELLKLGKIKEANTLLTVPFSITAPVEHGKGLGHHLGTPTFNQSPPQEMLIPARGVYLTRCAIDGKDYYGLTNIGTHPTVDVNAALNLETHLLDFVGDLYQKKLCVEFLDYIRPEICFDSKESLQEQIQKDIQTVRERL